VSEQTSSSHTSIGRSAVFVGVGAGSSRTEAVVTDETLEVLGRACADAGAVVPGKEGLSAKAIATAVRSALRDAEQNELPLAMVVGAAGAGAEREQSALLGLLERLSLARVVIVTTGTAIAHARPVDPPLGAAALALKTVRG
jgi:N-acetylglucosamine kinase-like BadF-type ATPase